MFPGEQQTPSVPGVSGCQTCGPLRFSSGLRGQRWMAPCAGRAQEWKRWQRHQIYGFRVFGLWHVSGILSWCLFIDHLSQIQTRMMFIQLWECGAMWTWIKSIKTFHTVTSFFNLSTPILQYTRIAGEFLSFLFLNSNLSEQSLNLKLCILFDYFLQWKWRWWKWYI